MLLQEKVKTLHCYKKQEIWWGFFVFISQSMTSPFGKENHHKVSMNERQ